MAFLLAKSQPPHLPACDGQVIRAMLAWWVHASSVCMVLMVRESMVCMVRMVREHGERGA